jgi:hypothetical protein
VYQNLGAAAEDVREERGVGWVWVVLGWTGKGGCGVCVWLRGQVIDWGSKGGGVCGVWCVRLWDGGVVYAAFWAV